MPKPNLLLNGRRAPVTGLGVLVVAPILVEPAQQEEHPGHVGVLRARELLPQRQCLVVERLGIVIALLVVNGDCLGNKCLAQQLRLGAQRKARGLPGRVTCVDKANVFTSMAFFRKVFEWDIEMNERLGYYITPASSPPGEQIDGGIFTLGKARLPFVALYIQVMDIDSKVKLIEENGGFIVEAPINIAGGSRICLFNEPSGVTFAMIQQNPVEKKT